MQLHPLLSDWLIYLLTLSTILLVIIQARKKQAQQTWALLCQSRTAMFSLIILSVFILITLTDSFHFNNGSLLDKAAPRLAYSHELTYSSPLSNQLSSSTHYTNAQGNPAYGKAPLRHITTDKAHDKHIFMTVLTGLLSGLALALMLGACFILGRSLCSRCSLKKTWAKFHPRHTNTQWVTIAVTTTGVLIVGSIAFFCASRFHLFGTSKIGHDVFYESLKGIRTAIFIGTFSTLFMLPMALIFGLLAGYFRGWVDDIIQYLYTTLSSIPGVLLISATILVMQLYIHNHPQLFSSLADRADARLIALCLILGLTGWANLCRLLRAETMKVKSYDFVQIAKVMKIPRLLILSRHILPNVFHIVLITIALDFSGLILAESVLSYIGVGVDPTTASWGNIINSARLEMAREPTVWWTLGAAMSMMFLLVLSANLFADALRDALDPSGRNKAPAHFKNEVEA